MMANLYRGSNFTLGEKEKNQFYAKFDRRPRNTPDWLHEAVNQWFYARFGMPVRGGCIFCTGSFYDAGIYGGVYKIWPIGEFLAFFSLNVKDLFDYFVENELHVNKMSKEAFETLMDSLGYECTSDLNRLMEVAAAEVEIMLYCEEYHAKKC